MIASIARRAAATGQQSGQAVLEFAIGLTVMLLLLLAVVDFSPAIVQTAQLSQAVREGAGYGRSAPTDTAGIQLRVRNSAPALGLADADIIVTCANGLEGAAKSCSSAVIGDSITVSGSFVYSPLSGQLAAIFGASLTITRAASSEIF